jgi:hypothetical protein
MGENGWVGWAEPALSNTVVAGVGRSVELGWRSLLLPIYSKYVPNFQLLFPSSNFQKSQTQTS